MGGTRPMFTASLVAKAGSPAPPLVEMPTHVRCEHANCGVHRLPHVRCSFSANAAQRAEVRRRSLPMAGTFHPASHAIGWLQYTHSPKRRLKDCCVVASPRSHLLRHALWKACCTRHTLHPSGSSLSAAAATTKCACACICVRVTCRPPSASCVFVRFALTSVDGTHRSPSHLRLTYCCPSWTTLHRFTCTSTIWNVAASILMDIVLPVGSR